jgi:hypothetical protein
MPASLDSGTPFIALLALRFLLGTSTTGSRWSLQVGSQLIQ